MAPVDGTRTVVDPNVFAALPDVDKVLEAEQVVQSRWATGIRIDAKNLDGNKGSYFMKVSEGHHGREAIKGEFEATSAIHAVVPNFCPKPIAWGTFASDADAHFYLCKFYEFAKGMPDPELFCANLATLHTQSKSPTGKFGFHCTTYNGDLPQDNTWCESWEVFFANGLRRTLRVRDERAGSRSAELDSLLPTLFNKVIPRLLRPLKISPALIHGDLWYGNASVLKESGARKEGIVYDPASFYGHNEYELGNWRPERNRFTKECFDAYHTHVPKSEPVEDYDDRIKLYEMRFNLNAAALLPDQPQFLQMVINGVAELNEKFKDSYV
ncbi:Fructosamine/Ketosamine-3-kinase [Naviculisporaceae sp. PSN 640]